jgi:hypothetical protein
MRLPSNWPSLAAKLSRLLQPAGLLLLALSAAFALHSWNFARHHIRTTGVVTENVATFAPGGGVVYTPRIRFRAGDGTTLQPVLGPASDEPEFTPGTAVPVLYPPGQPQSAVIATTGRAYTAAIWFGVWGVVLLDAGLILKRFSRPQSDQPVHR